MTDSTVNHEWALKELLTDVIGSGPNSATDMSKAQAASAMKHLLADDSDPVTIGAFLLANRWKRNTPEELASFIDVMRDLSVESTDVSVSPVDCGANYDGKTKTALLGVAAGIVAAAAGTPVVVHSANRIPATKGVTYRDVLADLRVETDITPTQSGAMVAETGFGFFYQSQFNPLVHQLLPRREALGVRSFLNTIETLANPANASCHLGSFFHRSFPEKIIDTIKASQSLEFDRVVMVRGLEGYDDARPERTTLIEWQDGSIQERDINAASFGLSVTSEDLGVTDVRQESAMLTESVLNHSSPEPIIEAVTFNAALRMYTAQDVGSIEAGISKARDVIRDGRAQEVLAELRSFSSVQQPIGE